MYLQSYGRTMIYTFLFIKFKDKTKCIKYNTNVRAIDFIYRYLIFVMVLDIIMHIMYYLHSYLSIANLGSARMLKKIEMIITQHQMEIFKI